MKFKLPTTFYFAQKLYFIFDQNGISNCKYLEDFPIRASSWFTPFPLSLSPLLPLNIQGHACPRKEAGRAETIQDCIPSPGLTEALFT